MLAALAFALVVQAPPPPPPVAHHFVLHPGSHTTVYVEGRPRTWFMSRPNVVTLGDVHTLEKRSAIVITASAPGSTAIMVGCEGGGRETWLVDVRPRAAVVESAFSPNDLAMRP